MSTIFGAVQAVAHASARGMGALYRTALPWLAVVAILCTGNVRAADESTSAEQKAQLAIPPEFRHPDFVWTTAEGDLNGDGIPDLALLLTKHKEKASERSGCLS